jgi:DNA-binding NarL/FixJ family response regulator
MPAKRAQPAKPAKPSDPAAAAPAARPPAAPPPPRKRVFLVDDHPLVRERLAELIHQEPDLVVSGEAEDAVTARRLIGAQQPDLAVVDITLKDAYGIELVKDLKERCPGMPILVLSMHDESLYGERALRAGAKGYLNKQEATKKVIPAIRTLLAGGIFASERLTAAVMQRLAGGHNVDGASPTACLTDRELEVFQLLGQGRGVRQVAEDLFVSVKTVEAHRENIKHKMGFRSSAELLRFAIEYTMKER